MQTKHHFRATDDTRLAADSYGSGRPVLLLHGGGQTRGAWHQTARALAERGYHAIALDARGHGESDWSKSGYSLDLFASDLKSVIAEVGGKPALVGASLGGLTAMLAAGEAEQPIASALILVDIATQLNPAGAKAIQDFMKSNPNGFETVEEAADAVSRYLPHRPRPKDVSGLKRNLRKREDGRYHWHWDPAVVAPRTAHSPQEFTQRLEAAASKLNIPTLLVRGGRSEIVTVEGVKRFQELVPNAECVQVDDAGHMVAGDANTAFAAAVLDFLKRVYPA
jgi:pimeloyl-ACP methyl ester carboxylesterase